MPWTMNDYPSSLKNFNKATRKKAIDIANAMVEEGYDENRAIPIATQQAKEWYENASEQEKETYVEEGDPTTHDTDYKSRPELLDKMEMVTPHSDNRWAVQSKDAKKPTKTFDNKSDAIDYGKHIAQNKQTGIIIYKSDGTKQQTIHYNE